MYCVLQQCITLNNALCDVPTLVVGQSSSNSPFTDSACCLTTITCTKPPKVMILINDESITKY